MMKLKLSELSTDGLSILCLGAHCDDIEIGCGGTMLQLADDPANSISWVVFCSGPERAAEASRAATSFLGKSDRHRLVLKDFRDGYLPWSGAAVKDAFEELKRDVRPDLVFTHYHRDLHQDHRLVSELTWNTFRDHLILEYEIPKWDGDLGNPNAYLELTAAQCDQKIAHLRDCYASQADKPWFTADVFRSMARIRGMECNAGAGLAEAYYLRKLGLSA